MSQENIHKIATALIIAFIIWITTKVVDQESNNKLREFQMNQLYKAVQTLSEKDEL